MTKSQFNPFLFLCILVALILIIGAQATHAQTLTSKSSTGFIAIDSMAGARDDQTSTLLRDGRVLIIGGSAGIATESASSVFYKP